jgi:hypothetical protein
MLLAGATTSHAELIVSQCAYQGRYLEHGVCELPVGGEGLVGGLRLFGSPWTPQFGGRELMALARGLPPLP